MGQPILHGAILKMIKPEPIVLLTDFGQKDTFVGILKGVIASICPESRVIDLSHEVNPQNIFQASFLLTSSYSFFPKGSIFCVIVDPGVGSNRKEICIKTRDYFFIGPDNGVLWSAANENKIKEIIHLTNTKYFLDSISNTFHGRDIFAPVCAHISKGLSNIATLGKPLKKCVELYLPETEKQSASICLSILHIDRFGNVILNLKENDFKRFIKKQKFALTINGVTINKVLCNYSQAKGGELFLIQGSSCYMEISLKNSNAAKKINAAISDKAVIEVINIFKHNEMEKELII